MSRHPKEIQTLLMNDGNVSMHYFLVNCCGFVVREGICNDAVLLCACMVRLMWPSIVGAGMCRQMDRCRPEGILMSSPPV